ncbi:hypothetical protein GPECTOR_54g241 [Gonium pectorale]|uniref:Sfi1 spindle body domain-containing protein n=1 Tax=Gonium pectorale TaxID=33097 RepID=A0A150G6K5_GONPE|nr:hypothetical protein GPECTOR_54g241 [Gonium pectorale]|eukprot:KXZ45499.1 hypothetical protein GPECTOR_54g241 [Gonium pectorale]
MEPRSLVRSTERKLGLNTGDVIMLSRQGRPYIAVQDRLPFKNDQIHTCLDLAPEGAHLEAEGIAYLEIIRQGPYLGFRSSAAGNRLVQPRRKSPHRLVFFNSNLGIWELWEVVGEEWISASWSTLPMVFRSRRLPHVQLEVDVTRVGFYTTSGGASGGAAAPAFAPTPRSLLPVIPEDSSLEDTNLRRISNVLVVEWFKFVDHEKLLRQGLETELAALVEEIAQLKLNTISQVEFLRVHMNEELAALAAHVTARDQMLALFKAWLRNTQQVAADHMARQRHRRILLAWRHAVVILVFHKAAISKLRNKRERVLRHRAFFSWLSYARGVAGAVSKLFVAVQRRAHAVMSRVLVGWRQAIAHRAWRGRVLLLVAQRRAARMLATAFAGWHQDASQRGVGRAALVRALTAVKQAGLPAIMTAWRAAVEAARRGEVQVLMTIALLSWRSVAVARKATTGRLALAKTRLVRMRLSAVVASWRQRAVSGKAARLGAEGLKKRLQVLGGHGTALRPEASGLPPRVGAAYPLVRAPRQPLRRLQRLSIIGSKSSPMLIEMAPGRGGEGPLTPIGLPELLDGDEQGSSEASFAQAQAGPDRRPGQPGTAKEPAGASQVAVQSLTASFNAVAAAYEDWLAPMVVGSGLGRWLAGEVLLHWRRVVTARRSWKGLSEQLVTDRRRRMARAVLAAMWDVAAAAKRVAAMGVVLAVKLAAGRSRSTCREVLVAWHEVARRRAMVRVQVTRHLARACAALSRHMLAEWHLVASAKRACAQKIQRLTREGKALERSAEVIRQRTEAAARAAVLEHWRARAARARREGVEVLKMQSRACRRRLAAVFQAWSHEVDRTHAVHALADALRARSERSLLLGVVEGWQAAARGSVQAKAWLATCVRRIQRGCVERAFIAWQEAATAARRRKSRMLLAARRVEAVLLSHVVVEWAAVVAHHRALRAEADVRHSACSRASLSAAFAGWADLVQRLKAAREVARRRGSVHDLALLRCITTGWMDAAHEARTRAEAAAAMAARKAAAVLPAALRAWADVACGGGGARRLQRAAVGHLVLRRCMALMRRAFRAWRGALEERHAREDELRRCIKRKKLAFGLFKQWYWEAFDADATIRRMFHSTDPAAHSPDPSMRARYANAAAAQLQPQHQPFAYGRAVGSYVSEWQQQHASQAAFTTSTWSAVPAGAGNGDSRLSSMPGARPVVDLVKGTTAIEAAASRLAAAGRVQRPLPEQPQQPKPQEQVRRPGSLAEPVRSLAPAFDALAATGDARRGRTAAASGAPAPLPASTAAAASGARAHQASAASGLAVTSSTRLVSVRSAYSALLHSDSDSDGEGPARGYAARTAVAAGTWNTRSKDAAAAAEVAGALRPVGISAAAGAVSKSRLVARTSGTVGVVSAAAVREAGAVHAGGPLHRMYGPAAAAAVTAAAAEPSVGSATSLEAVNAMNAMLVNVANQLTEVSRASLEIAAGVVAHSGGAGAMGPAAGGMRPLRSTTGSASSGAYLQPRASVDGSYTSGRSAHHRGSPPGNNARPGSAAAALAAAAGPALSPLSPGPLAAYMPYGNSAASVGSAPGTSGGKLPGVVPTWRQVANNQLYDAVDECYGEPYDDDLGPVDPTYIGIAGAGAAEQEEAESVGDFAAGPAECSRRGSAASSTGAGLLEQRAFTVHNTHWNDVFQDEDEDEEEDGDDDPEDEGDDSGFA